MKNVKNVELKEEGTEGHQRRMFDGEGSVRYSSEQDPDQYQEKKDQYQEKNKKKKSLSKAEVKHEKMEE